MPHKASSNSVVALPQDAHAHPSTGTSTADALAPDLVALFLGARPHPDVVIPEPRVTIADLAAAARASGRPADILRWDAAGQRFA